MPSAIETHKTRRVHPFMGPNLAYWRMEKGLGINELARLSTVSASLISGIELGKHNCTYGQACKLALALGITVEYLWDHRPPPATPDRRSSRTQGARGPNLSR